MIGIIAIKGGVGKTTLTASLGSALVHYFGKKVLLVDANYSAPNLGLHMDIIAPEQTIHDALEGKASMGNAIHRRHGVDVVAGSYLREGDAPYLKLKDKLHSLRDRYDVILIDGSPSLHDEILSTILASDSLLMVSTPDYPTLSCSLRAAKLARQRGKEVAGIVLNKIRTPRYELSLQDLEQSMGIPVVACIRDDPHQSKALALRIPLTLLHKNAPFSKEVRRLACSLSGEKARKGLFSGLFSWRMPKESINRELLKEHFYTSAFSS